MRLLVVASWASAFLVAPPAPHPTRLYFFDQLTESMASVASMFSGKKRLTQKSIGAALKTVKKALVDADVNLKVANALIAAVEQKAIGQEAVEGVEPSQQFVKIMYDELVKVMGGDGDMQGRAELKMGSKKTVILLCGLQGAGKTTAAAKLANYLKENDKKPCLVAADVYRPAAAEQLRILGEQIGVRVYSEEDSKDAVGIAKRGVESADEDVVVVDTAGRQVIEESLMTELVSVRKAVNPDETLLVLDAMTGQDAARLCSKFNDACPLTGAVLTKLDGDARGGAALSVKAVSGIPIKFVGVGEKIADLEPFYPARMASRILNMGDVVTLVEKAQKQVSEEDMEAQMARASKGKFNFDDYLTQTKALDNVGSMANIAKMMPGMKLDDQRIREVEDKAKRAKALINSMTKKERTNPELLIRDKSAVSRMTRVAKGSGRTLQDAQSFVSEFQNMQNMMTRFATGQTMNPDGTINEAAALPGNRKARRAAKKKGKGKSKAAGFG